MLDEVRDVGLTTIYAFISSLWTLVAMYLENDLSVSVGRVLFIGSIAALVSLLGYIFAVKEARNVFLQDSLLLLSLFGLSLSNNDNNNEFINRRMLEIKRIKMGTNKENNIVYNIIGESSSNKSEIIDIGNVNSETQGINNVSINSANILNFSTDTVYCVTKSDIKEYFFILFIRGLLGNICVALLLLATSIIDSVANLNAIYRCMQLLLGIFFSLLFIKDEKVSYFTIFVIVPLSIIGIILIIQPSFIFDYISFLDSSNDDSSDDDNGVSWIGLLLLFLSALLRMITNLIVKQWKRIEWYMISLSVSIGGIFIGFICLLIDIYINNNSSEWNNLFFTINSGYGDNVGIIFCYNLLLLSWGFLDFIVVFFLTYLYQVGNFVIVTLVGSTFRTLITYLLEYVMFDINLNLCTYIGMIIIVVSSILYNLEFIYDNKKGEKSFDTSEESQLESESQSERQSLLSQARFYLNNNKNSDNNNNNKENEDNISEAQSSLSNVQISQ